MTVNQARKQCCFAQFDNLRGGGMVNEGPTARILSSSISTTTYEIVVPAFTSSI